MEKTEMCPTCGKNPAAEPHTCPYETEINDNYELCTCCEDCESDCSDEI